MRLKTAVICLALGGTALASHALNLGRARGAAWIGQPLSLAVALQLEPGQTAEALCPEADVFYADTKLESNRIQVSVEPAAQADTATLRVLTSLPVDEPVVTLYVRAGCNNKSTRRYVLLADYASDVSSATAADTPAAAVNPPVQATAPMQVAAPNIPSTSGSISPPPAPAATPSNRSSSASGRLSGRASAKTSAREPTLSAPSATPVPPAKPSAPRSARLQLDPLENLTERIKTLEATTSSAPLKELVEDSQRIQQLQGDVKALLNQAAKNEANLLALRERLDKAESERIPNTWVMALLVLVAGGTAAAILAWNRRAPEGWQTAAPPLKTRAAAAAPIPAHVPQMEEADHWSPAPPDTHPATVALKTTAAQRRASQAPDPLDMGPEDFKNSVSVSTPADVSNSDMMGFDEPRLLHTDLNPPGLIDLQQEAEFFTTLGNTNAAIEVLEKRIRQNPEDCPLLYLQLLQIANQHNLKTDFRQYREECMQWFNVEVPEFALFRHDGRSLEDYPELLAHITRLWPDAKVMDVIETCALYDPQAQVAARFDMAAFRDLIALHGVARYVAYHRPKERAPDPSEAEHIALDL
jgi:hypothetical protein